MSTGELLAERELDNSNRYERDRSYWLARIDALPPPPELPVQEIRSEVARFERHQVTLPASPWEALGRRAANHRLSPTGVVLAAYAEVIGTWSRRPRFTLSVTVPSRLQDIDHLAGDIPAVTLLAVDQSRPEPFADRAQALGVQLAKELDHQRFSGVEVMQEISRRRGRGSALMSVMFTSSLTTEPGPVSKTGSGLTQALHTWINCHTVDRNGGLVIDVDTRAGVFPDGLVPDMVQALHRLLIDLTSGADAWASPYPVDLPAGQRACREKVNATAAPVPKLLLQDRVCAQASATPERTALLWPGGSMSYGELLGRARAVAAQLGALGPGELVAVVMDKGWEQVAAVLGVGLSGAAYLPIDTTYPLDTTCPLKQMLADAGVREVLTQSWIDETTAWPEQLRITVVDRCDPITESGPSSARGAGQDDLACVIHTSGSTGPPKGVMITHRAAVNTIEDITTRFGIGAGDRVLGVAGLGSSLSVYDIFGVLGAGGALVLPCRECRADPAHWAKLIAAHGVTLWNSVPAQLQLLSDYLDVVPARGLSSLRLALLSGDWIPVTLPEQVRQRLPRLRLINLGGATEAAIWSSYHPIEEVAPGTCSIPYGRPLANQSCHVLDWVMRPRPEWVPGKLYIGGAGVARGYLGEPERTRQQFVIHPETGQRLFRTGDLARYLPGGVIEFLGRPEFQVTIHGHCVELATVESAVQTHPAVGSVAVVVDAREALDPQLVAFVVGARRPPLVDDELDLRCVTAEAGRRAPRTSSHRQVMQFIEALNRAELVSMVCALRSIGLFRNSRDAHHVGEILATARIRPAYHGLIRRWLHALVDEELLIQDVAGRLRLTKLFGSRSAARAWDNVTELRAGEICPAEMFGYLRASAEQLPALLTGTVDPVRMFLPEGQLHIARAMYADNALARYLNEVAAAAVRRIASARPNGVPLRVLEVGAGTGATTACVIPALSGFALDYLFTDVSRLFLDHAEKTFQDAPAVRFGLFDINAEHRSQGLRPNSFDVVICTGALNDAFGGEQALSQMRELLIAGGWLVLVEPTRERYEILTSQAFMRSEAPGRRHDEELTSPTREQWLATLRRPGDEVALCLPTATDPLSRLGQHVFVTQVKRDTEPIEEAELTAHVASRLPEYMVPADIQVVDALPLCHNGKVDRARLRCLKEPPDVDSSWPVQVHPAK